MTLRELIDGIEDNTIEVDFGRAFLDLNNPKKYSWSIIKSYMLTLDKSRKTKTAKLMRPLCDEYNNASYDRYTQL
jgi:hypothetical protein